MAKPKIKPPELTAEERLAASEERLGAVESRLARLDAAFVGFVRDYPNIHAGYFADFLAAEDAEPEVQQPPAPKSLPVEDESEEEEEEDEDNG